MKRTAIISLVCGLVFGLAATLLGPKLITYWYQPPAPHAFDCTAQVQWGLYRLVWTQFIATGIGLLVGIIVALLLHNRKAHRLAAKTQAASQSPAGQQTVKS
jgi:hypothetical protein